VKDARHPFTPSVIMYAPAAAGVYLLWDRDVLIFVGHARSPETIFERLMDHYCGRARPSQATHCAWELVEVDAWLDRISPLGVAADAEAPSFAEAD
jgi:hypothetical protein